MGGGIDCCAVEEDPDGISVGEEGGVRNGLLNGFECCSGWMLPEGGDDSAWGLGGGECGWILVGGDSN